MNQTATRALLVLGTALFGAYGASVAWAADAIEQCTNCHGKDGVSIESDVPIIASYSEPYTSDSLAAYKNKERPCPETKYRDGPQKGEATDMCRVAESLSDAEVEQVAKFFAGKKFVRAQQTADPVLAKNGAQIHERNCEKCHSESGSIASDDSGIQAGQWMPYLKQVFADLSNGKRPMGKKMKPKIENLQPEDVDALVNYYGSFK